MNTIHKTMQRFHQPEIGILFLRLALAAVFINAGWMKLADMSVVVAGFAGMGLSAGVAYLVAWSELLGGIAMLLGVWVRYAGVVLAVIMLVAIFMVLAPNGFSLANGGYEYALVLLSVSLALVTLGAGRYALAPRT